MNDPVLDRRLDNCKKLMNHWRKFHDYLNDCIKGKEFTAQDEADFLKLKSQIAILHDSFLESVDSNKLSTAQGVIDVIERCILLRQVSKMHAAEIKKMEIEWHESYLLLNETIGSLQEEIDRIAKVSRITFETKKAADKAFTRFTRFVTNRTVHFVAGSLAVIGVAIILPMMGVFNYDFLTKYPITNKLYTAARGMARGVMMKELEFLAWEDYKENFRQDMPGGYNPQDVPANQKTGMKNSFVVRSYPGVEPFNIKEETEKAVYSEVEKFNKDGSDIYIFFAMFKKTDEAKTILQKYESWRTAIPVGSAADQQEKMMRSGRVINVYYTVYAQNPGLADPLVETLGKK